MKVDFAINKDKSRWNGYCEKQINLPPLSRFEWKDILENSYGAKVFPILAFDDQDQVCGILPLYEIKDYSGRSNIYSLKFGLVADNTQVAESLVKFANQLAQERNATKMTLSSGYYPYQLNANHTLAKTVTLDILPSENEMWKNIRGKARNMVKKAMKDGITVEQGISNLEEFYSVYSSRMLQKGVRIHSLNYFNNIAKHLGEQTQLFVARKSGEIIGGMFLIYSGDSGAYLYGGSMVDRGTSPNQLMLWEMVCFCISKGIKFLDLGESIEGSGVYNFKIWFGGIPEDIYYYNYPNKSARIPTLLRPAKFLQGNLLRYSSYFLLHYGTPCLKRKAGIWKRQKGPLQ